METRFQAKIDEFNAKKKAFVLVVKDKAHVISEVKVKRIIAMSRNKTKLTWLMVIDSISGRVMRFTSTEIIMVR